jgi:hypothetical protein
MISNSSVRATSFAPCFPRIVRIVRMSLFPVLLGLATAAYCGDGSMVDAHWVGSWATSEQLLEPGNALSREDLRDVTLRQIVHLSLGGSEIRLRLSNRFGSAPLHLTAIHVARSLSPDSDKTVPGTGESVTFSGSRDATIPPHSDYISDPVSFAVNKLSDLAITLILMYRQRNKPATPVREPFHTSSVEIWFPHLSFRVLRRLDPGTSSPELMLLLRVRRVLS